MTIHTSLKTFGRAALVAAALSATALAAMPAQAAPPPPNFNFSLQLGGPSMTFGGGGIQLQLGNGPTQWCLSNSQIRYMLKDDGWKNPKIVKELSSTKVIAVAMWYDDWYQMRVDRCTGKVDKVKPLPPPKSNGNFSITLSF